MPFVVPLLLLYGLDAPLNTLGELGTLFTDGLADTADVADLGDIADVMDVADNVDACKFADVSDDESNEVEIAVEKFENEEGAVDPQLHCVLVDDLPTQNLEIEKKTGHLIFLIR